MSARGTGLAAIAEARIHPDILRRESAATAGVSEPMITWARRIVRSGIPELIVAVEDGRIALYMGARICRWAPASQREVISILKQTEGETLSLTVFQSLIPPAK